MPSGTPPNTSIVLTDAELKFINRRFAGSKSAAIHAALENIMPRTYYDSAFVQSVIAEMDTSHAILAVDADDSKGPFLTPKFGRDGKSRSYIIADTIDELRQEITDFDATM